MNIYGPGVEWHGDKAYFRCADCGKVVQANKPRLGSLHFCITTCEKYGHDWQPRKTFWRGKFEQCTRCERRIEGE